MIAALFVRSDSVYKTLGVDCWDADRDARFFRGPGPIIAHPPCAQWARLKHFAHKSNDVKALAIMAVLFVQKFGGVLEHPAYSSLWDHMHLPKPGGARAMDKEFSIAAPQLWWGHPAEKKTWLYFFGITPSELPEVPLSLKEPSHCIDTSTSGNSRLKHLPKSRRDVTPVGFAKWLIRVAERCDS